MLRSIEFGTAENGKAHDGTATSHRTSNRKKTVHREPSSALDQRSASDQHSTRDLAGEETCNGLIGQSTTTNTIRFHSDAHLITIAQHVVILQWWPMKKNTSFDQERWRLLRPRQSARLVLATALARRQTCNPKKNLAEAALCFNSALETSLTQNLVCNENV